MRPSFQLPPFDSNVQDFQVRDSINAALTGLWDNAFLVDITESAATTEINDPGVDDDSMFWIFPMSAATRSEFSFTAYYVSSITRNEGFTLTHPNNATAGRKVAVLRVT